SSPARSSSNDAGMGAVTFEGRPPLFGATAPEPAGLHATPPALEPGGIDLAALGTVSRPGPAPSVPAAAAPVATRPAPDTPSHAARAEASEVVIPVTLPRGSTREIVVRIVFSQED